MTDPEPQWVSRKAADRDWLSRKEAAAYLTKHGYPISAGALANRAANNNKGKGPPFQRSGWKTVRYHRDDLDAWRKSATQRVE